MKLKEKQLIKDRKMTDNYCKISQARLSWAKLIVFVILSIIILIRCENISQFLAFESVMAFINKVISKFIT